MGNGTGGGPNSAGHQRRGSLYRHQTSTLFSAFGEDDELEGSGREAVSLQRLREEPEPRDDDDDADEGESEEDEDDDASDADERTHLRLNSRKDIGNGHARESTRSHSNSPRPLR